MAKIMDDIIPYDIDMLRDKLHIAIVNNEELLNSDYILKLSQELDKLIVAEYKKQLNTNNE
ncbi:aspartyl-phosphate phosphatase Spo0E family protein [uncultured Clostridium sp.]|uniref:aspartyl-phosphate phosphatase Spo0E family protein n=1 Tax=uncultured Clostridium sp. TaxID=59620 RepID=UPI0028E2BD32|nr:aspartyl-phosphate phosphatase Spo0E family protein [uncultured Clostridium sp.]